MAKAKAVWIRQLDAARQAQIAVVVEILGELDYLKTEAAELDPSLVAECVIRNVDLNGVFRDLEEASEAGHVSPSSSGEQNACLTDKVPSSSIPPCPRCSGEMAVRVVRNGPRAGSRFFGCLSYPSCKGTAPVEA